MTTTFKLTVQDGTLYFPCGGMDWDERHHTAELPSLLLCRYDAGDCDTCPWPMESQFATTAQLRERLALALYDERETNGCWPNTPYVVILLPDGTPFDLDDVLADRVLRDATVTWNMEA